MDINSPTMYADVSGRMKDLLKEGFELRHEVFLHDAIPVPTEELTEE